MNQEYIDVHAHLNFSAYDNDRWDVIKRTQEGKCAVINVGTQIDTSKKAIELAEKNEGMYAIVGLHPVHTSKSYHDEQELGSGGKEFTLRGEVFDYDFYKKLSLHPKVVAIGECGLDFFRIENSKKESGSENQELSEEEIKEKQIKIFKQQIELAIELDKPLMIHSRNAYAQTFDILDSYFLIHNSRLRANIHFFAGSLDEAKKFLDLGCTLSFTGVITFARNYDEVIKNTSLDRIMSETDSPYVTPVPYRGKRNEPLYVKEVVKKIAEIRGEDFEIVRKQLVENAQKFFKLK